jgi:hypothetical protein
MLTAEGARFSDQELPVVKNQAAKPRLFCERVEDNAFHLSGSKAYRS